MSVSTLALRIARRLRRYRLGYGLGRSKKIFAVGFNKTGTTSIDALFDSLGLYAYHGTLWRDCEDRDWLSSYDCFTDGPPADLARLDHWFPGSRFILNVRDLDTWVHSRIGHIERRKAKGIHESHPTWEDNHESVVGWIRERDRYHRQVLSYFRERPQDLLVVNFVRDDDAATKVANFAGFRVTIRRPAEKVRRSHSDPRHTAMFAAAAEELGLSADEAGDDLLTPSLAPVPDWLAADTRDLVWPPA